MMAQKVKGVGGGDGLVWRGLLAELIFDEEVFSEGSGGEDVMQD